LQTSIKAPETSCVIPATRYAKTDDGVSIAFQLVGRGTLDLAWMPGFVSGNVEVVWEHPLVSSFLEKLASIGRLILHDRRGTGLSDRAARLPDLETRAADLLAVLDAAGSRRPVLMGGGEAGALCALLAATRPSRVASFIWWHAAARTRWAPDYPWGESEEGERSWLREVERGWGTEAFASAFVALEAPSVRGDDSFIRWLARMQRHWVTPGSAAELVRIWYETDVRHVLPSITVPTLIIGREDPANPEEEREYVASRIQGAERVALPGDDSPPYVGDQESVLSAITRFLRIERSVPVEDRVLATVLFTDIVGSGKRAAELGDRAWGDLLQRHHSTVRALLAEYRGREVDTAGDGFFATFDGPARAAKCAKAIIEGVKPLGIEVRAGVHTGEVETIAGKTGGMAVVIGSRVGAMAQASEVLASQTVKDLTAGSGLVFEDAGEQELKGVPDRWHLYRVLE
jgi:class 3 adenylate cyclase